jgi:hypothetical protein
MRFGWHHAHTGRGIALGKAAANAYFLVMNLSLTQQHAIEARMALIVGAEEYDRLFLGFQCTELEGDILFVDALDEDCAAEIEDPFSLHIAIIATEILRADVASVVVLPRVLN